jgi:hypothetical protein
MMLGEELGEEIAGGVKVASTGAVARGTRWTR